MSKRRGASEPCGSPRFDHPGVRVCYSLVPATGFVRKGFCWLGFMKGRKCGTCCWSWRSMASEVISCGLACYVSMMRVIVHPRDVVCFCTTFTWYVGRDFRLQYIHADVHDLLRYRTHFLESISLLPTRNKFSFLNNAMLPQTTIHNHSAKTFAVSL